jgi:hypothetical protein
MLVSENLFATDRIVFVKLLAFPLLVTLKAEPLNIICNTEC